MQCAAADLLTLPACGAGWLTLTQTIALTSTLPACYAAAAHGRREAEGIAAARIARGDPAVPDPSAAAGESATLAPLPPRCRLPQVHAVLPRQRRADQSIGALAAPLPLATVQALCFTLLLLARAMTSPSTLTPTLALTRHLMSPSQLSVQVLTSYQTRVDDLRLANLSLLSAEPASPVAAAPRRLTAAATATGPSHADKAGGDCGDGAPKDAEAAAVSAAAKDAQLAASMRDMR